MGKRSGRAKGKAKAKRNAVKAGALVAGVRVKLKAGSPWPGEVGEVQGTDGVTALVKLDCKDVAQFIPVEQLARA